jgi:transmembrane sensor
VAYTPTGQVTPVEEADLAGLTAWRQGQIVFRGHRLEEVLAKLGRYHDTLFLVRDPALRGLLVSGTFCIQDLDSVLSAIELTLPIRARHLGARRILIEPAD